MNHTCTRRVALAARLLPKLNRAPVWLATGAIIAVGLLCAQPAIANDVTGSIDSQSLTGGGTINEGQSVGVGANFTVSGGNSSGFAGTTTHRFNSNTINFSSPGSVSGSQNVGDNGAGGTSQSFSTSFTYNTPGTYNVSYGGTETWLHTANGSWGTGSYSGTGSQGVGGNGNIVTVNNLAPTIVTAKLDGTNGNISVPQGSTVVYNMSGSDPGTEIVNFNVSGNPSNVFGTAGTTRVSGNFSESFVAVGSFNRTFSMTDQYGAAATNNNQVRTVTVTNVLPQNLALQLSSSTIFEGQSVNVGMTATDPGNDTLSFTINGNSAGTDSSGIPGGTRTSSTISLGPYTEHAGGSQAYTITGSVFDGTGTSTTTATLTVLNVAPIITSLVTTELVNPAGTGCLHFFTATAFDPGIFDVVTFYWDLFGNNTFTDFIGPGTTPTILYGYGTHTVGVYAQDDDTGVSSPPTYITFECAPEPATWVVMLLAGGTVAFFARRRRKKT